MLKIICVIYNVKISFSDEVLIESSVGNKINFNWVKDLFLVMLE